MQGRVLLLLAGALFACGDADPIDPTAPRLTLSADSVLIPVGSATQVTATITNSTATPQFESRNPQVAIVDGSGRITGVSVGRTVVVSSLPGFANVRDSVVVAVGAGTAQIPLLGTATVPERFTAEVAVAGSYAYTSTWSFRAAPGNAIKIWNVSGNTPVLIDSLIVANAGTLGDVQISADGSLLVAAIEGGTDNGIVIFDRTNPAKPTLITRFSTATTRQGIHTLKLGTVNNRHYAFLAVDPSLSDRSKLAIIDITNPAAPTEGFVQEMGDPFIHDVFIRDGVLFAALWHTGLTIFDVGGGGRGGSPAAPVPMGTVKTANCSTCGTGTSSAHNVWWFHDPGSGSKRYAFVGEEGPSNLGGFQRASGDVHVIDVSNLTAPREVAFYQPDSTTTTSGRMAGAHNFVMDEASGILYAAFYNGGVRALDVRGDLGSCPVAQQSADGRCDLRKMGREVGVALNTGTHFVWGVALQGTALYASDMPNGLHKLDISALKR